MPFLAPSIKVPGKFALREVAGTQAWLPVRGAEGATILAKASLHYRLRFVSCGCGLLGGCGGSAAGRGTQ